MRPLGSAYLWRGQIRGSTVIGSFASWPARSAARFSKDARISRAALGHTKLNSGAAQLTRAPLRTRVATTYASR